MKNVSALENIHKHGLFGNHDSKDELINIREIKEGIKSGSNKVIKYLEKQGIPVDDGLLEHVATISTNNDRTLGKIISSAYKKVGKDGVVLMEESQTGETYVDVVDGIQPVSYTHLTLPTNREV